MKRNSAQFSDAPHALPGTTGTCDATKEGVPVVTNSGFTDVPTGDEDALKSAVAQQPVSVAIEADKSVFQLYASGVLDSTACGTQLDHGVLVVGYGTDMAAGGSGTDYWKVKNSWGATWGEEGYIYLEMAKNTCGLADDATIPEVKLDLTAEEHAEAAVKREAMYQRATLGA